MINNVGYQTNPYYTQRTFPQSFYSYTLDKKALSPMQKPVSFKEGAKIIGKGIWNKIKDIGKSIIQHPIKTIAAIACTSLTLMALPFIGISMATGGAALVVGFGSLAIFNTCKNIYKAHKNSKKGDFNAVRQNLNNLGGDIVDLALTLPFMPKALKHLKRNVPLYLQKNISIAHNTATNETIVLKKYYGGSIKYKCDKNGKIIKTLIKKSLYSQMKKAKTWKERLNLLLKQDNKEKMYEEINHAYKQIAKERGYLPYDIKFNCTPEEFNFAPIGNNRYTMKDYHMERGFVSQEYGKTVNTNVNGKLNDIIKNVGHEHRHTEQNSMIARMEGMTDKEFTMNADNLILNKNGLIKKGTPEYELAQKFYEAHKNYPKNPSTAGKAYTDNFLEVDARNVGGVEIAGQIENKLRKNLKIGNDAPLIFDSAKYNPTKDMLVSNGLTIEQQV